MTNLKEYLEYYSELEAPGYAVLVTGAWGTGKTFQVKECIPEENRVYVSLYGVQSVEQIHAEVFAAAHPKKDKTKRFLEKFRDKAVGVAGFTVPLGVVPDVANVLLRNELKPEKIIIFDDLERSGIDLKEVLGTINFYVEHMGFRVVVIAHDDERFVGEDFRTVKEKTFGQTILVEPQIECAFEHFLADINLNKAREFVAGHKTQIKDIFLQSSVKSLRILRYLVEDLSRLHSTLNERHLKNTEAMRELVQAFTALGIEVRSGRLKEQDIRTRQDLHMRYIIRAHSKAENQTEKPPFVVAKETYPNIELESGMLNDDVLVATLIDGRYPIEGIQESIDNSPHFLVPEEVQPWKVVIHFDELDDKTVEAARERMEQQFRSREVTNSGEMLHIFCLRMMMAENGIIDRTVDDIVNESKAYIDDLLKSGKLPPRGTDFLWFDVFDRSYDGFTYWVSDANEKRFKAIWDHLIGSREKALQQTFPGVREDLLRMVREDSKAFLEAVSHTNNGHNPYAEIPLLYEIPVTEFVDAWLDGKPENRRNVEHALQNRYGHGQLERDLKEEREWALKLAMELDERSQKEKGFRALRIKRLKPRILIELVQAADSVEAVSVPEEAEDISTI
ncbi:hypothetical protein [Celeribacter halophilus]|uniref:hypothetical protein n=1 Tax=Celeribacter halophilus TaxID=576117 RepID=UPI003A925C79